MNLKVEDLKMLAIAKTGRSLAVISKYSPEILIGVGIVGIIATTVLASKATLKVESIMEDANSKLSMIRNAKAEFSEEKYSQKDAQKDLVLTYAQTAGQLIKLYGPALLVGVVSISCILGSHKILQTRNIGLAAAYKLVEESYSQYRKRVAAEFGEEKERDIHYNIQKEKVSEVIEENGKKKTVKKSVDVIAGASQYARFFDESCREYEKSPEHNLFFLRTTENYCNDLLRIRGHVFLNEVYDLIGIPRTSAGAVVGWVKDSGEGDGFITFGIYDRDSSGSRAFVNGYERVILLDFNVDGIILELI